MVKPITKYAVIVQRVEDLAKEIKKTSRIANTGRKGLVLIDIPKDVMIDKCQFMYPLESQFKAERWGESENRYQRKQEVFLKKRKDYFFLSVVVLKMQ
nr:thiamine pyrophosphate-binding protein [endosymbiont 'TC1' of Trimyema compressum]